MRQFDPVLYQEGDIVIRKNKGKNIYGAIPKPETIYKTAMVDSGTGYEYQILYFYTAPSSPNVAFEFEPYDEVEKKAYYDLVRQSQEVSAKKPKVKKSRTTNKESTQDAINEFLKGKL